MAIVKCVVPGCGGTEFVPASLQLDRVPIFSFERKNEVVTPTLIGSRVCCARCGQSQNVCNEESFMTGPALIETRKAPPPRERTAEREPEAVPTAITP